MFSSKDVKIPRVPLATSLVAASFAGFGLSDVRMGAASAAEHPNLTPEGDLKTGSVVFGWARRLKERAFKSKRTTQ